MFGKSPVVGFFLGSYSTLQLGMGEGLTLQLFLCKGHLCWKFKSHVDDYSP